MKSLALIILSAGKFSLGSAKKYDGFNENFETLFVVELARHGARSHLNPFPSPVPKDFFGQGVGPGDIT